MKSAKSAKKALAELWTASGSPRKTGDRGSGRSAPMDEISKGHPICFAVERRCPPDDVGGVNGYYELMEAIFDPDPQQSYEQFSAWTNGRFQLNRVRSESRERESFTDEV